MRATLIVLGLCMSSAALAADKAPAPAASDAVEIPGDIFGFTSATDTGGVGDRGLGLEIDGLLGSRDGRYRYVTQKLEYSYTFADNWSVAASVFGALHNIRNVTVIPGNVSSYRFDGFSFEVRHRLIERTAAQPFAVTIAAEPRWARVDGEGVRADAMGVEMKVQIDAPITDRLFWAMNANVSTAGEQNEATGRWSSASGSTLSTALAYSFADGKVFLGAEARWLQSYEDTFFGRRTDYAVFVGPALLVKLSDKASVNATFQPQVAGRDTAVAKNLDLRPFDRSLFRLKLAVGF
jgi:hypothetical protein